MRRDGQSGQLMIIVAIGMTAIMGLAAVAVDLGNAYSQRRLAQNGADAAAMAAMRMVRMNAPSTPGSTIYAEVQRLAALNGNAQVDSPNTVFVDASKNSLGQVSSYAGSLDNVVGVRVTTSIRYRTYFAAILGFDTLTSGGKATAMSFRVSSPTGVNLVPIAVREHPNGDSTQDYQPGTEYTLWDSGMECPGNAGWLDFDAGDNGSPAQREWILNGFESSDSNPFTSYVDDTSQLPAGSQTNRRLHFPAWLQGDTGITATAGDAVTTRVGQSVTLLLYSKLVNPGSNAKYRIVGLAQFTITSANKDLVKGVFERMVLSGDYDGVPTNSSMSTVKLTNN
ncbi:MAG TPA: pilus assembly protein TadG-related protein [Chloroflexota bacterium]|nr:pilus assembly protein TadG-related protein [Chloroflexota bacterium]